METSSSSAGEEGEPGQAGTLMVWDSRTGRRLREIRETHGRTQAVAFRPGRVLVASIRARSPDDRDPATGLLKAGAANDLGVRHSPGDISL